MNSEIPFHDLNLSPELLAIIEKKGFKTASEIQAKAIPLILQGTDVVGIAQTGTGKTAAFGLPMMDMISTKDTHIKTIILTPTRELAIQVSKELDFFKGAKNLKTLPVYGGQPIFQQIRDLRRGIDIVVGTPGRVMDLINRRVLVLDKIEFFVLDEADEMLKMGFIDDIETIMAKTPKEKQTLLFSATMAPRIKALLPKYMNKPTTVEVKKTEVSKKNIEQSYHIVRRHDKFETIKNIIDMTDGFHGIIFCQTKAIVDEFTGLFHKEKRDVNCIHGDIAQASREKILQQFRDRKINILVATDVAARGIDIEDLTHVINHSLPREIDSYVHRIGRTGRAGKKGIAITLIDPREEHKIRQIFKMTGNEIKFKPLPSRADVAAKKQEKMLKELEDIVNTKDTFYYQKTSEELVAKFGDTSLVAALLYQLNGGIPKKETPRPQHSERDRGGRGGGGRGGDRRPRREGDRRSSNRSGERSRGGEDRRRSSSRPDDRRSSWSKPEGERSRPERAPRQDDRKSSWSKPTGERSRPERAPRQDDKKTSWDKPTGERSEKRRTPRKQEQSLPWDKPRGEKKTTEKRERKPKNRGKKRREG